MVYKEKIMAVFEVTSPEGEIFEINAPDDATDAQVMAYAQQNFNTAIEDKGLIDRINERSNERNQEVYQTFDDLTSGVIGHKEAMLQLIGKGVAGKALDIIGESVVSGIETVGEGFEAVGAPIDKIVLSIGDAASGAIPDFIEEPVKQAIVNGWEWVKDGVIGTKAMEAVKSGADAWAKFKAENPNAAKDIESAMNIGILFAPAKVKKNAEPSLIKTTAQHIEEAARKQIAGKKDEFIKDLILPKQTSKVRIEQIARTSEVGKGIFRRGVVNLSPEQQKIADVIKSIQAVSNKNSLTKNYINIDRTLTKEANRLERTLASRKIPLNKNQAIAAMDDVMLRASSENPLIVGDAALSVSRTGDYAKKLISESDGTAAGMLRARREFDKWVLSQSTQRKAFGDLDSAFSIGVREIRNKMNELTDMAVGKHIQRTGSVGLPKVREQLARQSQMFKALENIAPKAADEHSWAIGRAIQNAVKVLPVSTAEKIKREIGLLLGIGAFGASAYFAPYLAAPIAVGITGYLGGRLVMSAGAKQALAKTLKLVDSAINTSTNPSMIRQLRADRAAILEAIKATEETMIED